MKKVLIFALLLIFSGNVFAQKTDFDLTAYGVRVEPDKRLITVLASLETAGAQTPLSAKGAKFREQLQTDLQTLPMDFRLKVKTFIDRYTLRFAERYSRDFDERQKKEFNEFFAQYKDGFKSETERKTLTEKYKSFYSELLAPFVSMAYSLAPAPDLTDPARTTDLPGDLLEVLDYAPLAREFYRRMTGAKIDEYAKIYQREADADLRRSANQMVGELLDYLHTKPQLTVVERTKISQPSAKGKKTLEKTETRVRERRFFIVPEMLAPKGAVNFLNIRDDYFAVVPLDTDLSQSEVRRAFLQFTLDPLILTNGKDLSAQSDAIKKLLADLNQSRLEREKAANKNARLEDVSVSPDAFLAVSRSLIAAADARQYAFQKLQTATQQARLNKTAPISEQIDAGGRKVVKLTNELFLINGKFVMPSVDDEVALRLSEAYDKGAVLAFYFADQLKGLEDSGFDIASSFKEMILSLDAAKEANRYAQFADARKRAAAAREAEKLKSADITTSGVLKSVTVKLLEIDKIIQNKNFAAAKTELERLLETNPSDAPRIYYALGRSASLSAVGANEEQTKERLLEAKAAYENVIRAATAPISDSRADSVNVNSPNKDRADTARALVSLSYVGLARIFEHYGETEYAVKIYEAAIRIGNVPDGAYAEAVAAKERLTKKP